LAGVDLHIFTWEKSVYLLTLPRFEVPIMNSAICHMFLIGKHPIPSIIKRVLFERI
jgi:hypothetical protein